MREEVKMAVEAVSRKAFAFDAMVAAGRISQELAEESLALADGPIELTDATTIRQALRDQEAEIARLREVAGLVPSNWCDPLLTGVDAALGKPPYNCPDIERLLNGIRERIQRHLTKDTP